MRKLIFVGSLITSTAFAQAPEVSEAVKAFNRTEVTLSGNIAFDDSSLGSSDYSFRFYDAQKQGYWVIMDAGRRVREEIEQNCEADVDWISFGSIDEFCRIEATGIISIDGTRIALAIDTVEALEY